MLFCVIDAKISKAKLREWSIFKGDNGADKTDNS